MSENPKLFESKSYPIHATVQPSFEVLSTDITLRDLFAAAALSNMRLPADYSTGPHNAMAAERSYQLADAMLAERAKR